MHDEIIRFKVINLNWGITTINLMPFAKKMRVVLNHFFFITFIRYTNGECEWISVFAYMDDCVCVWFMLFRFWAGSFHIAFAQIDNNNLYRIQLENVCLNLLFGANKTWNPFFCVTQCYFDCLIMNCAKHFQMMNTMRKKKKKILTFVFYFTFGVSFLFIRPMTENFHANDAHKSDEYFLNCCGFILVVRMFMKRKKKIIKLDLLKYCDGIGSLHNGNHAHPPINLGSSSLVYVAFIWSLNGRKQICI